MTDIEMKLKPGAVLNEDEVAKIACALKALCAYTALACDHEDDPEDLQNIVDEGLDAMNRLFD